METILVTGGAGFIGSNLIRYLLADKDRHITIVNLDKLTYAGSTKKLGSAMRDERHVFVHGDVCCKRTVSEVFEMHAITSVIHLAAETHVDRSIADAQVFLNTNVLGTHNLLHCVHSLWKAGSLPTDFRFIYVSTDEVYGPNSGHKPFGEGCAMAPTNPYAVSKAAGEMMAMSYMHTYDLPVLAVRCSNIYGPRQNSEKLIAKLILGASSGIMLQIYGDGQQIRQWIYVDDVCTALEVVLSRGEVGEIYNVGGNEYLTNMEVAERVIRAVRIAWGGSGECPAKANLIKRVTDRPGHDRRYWIDSRKLLNMGWRPEVSFDEGLARTVELALTKGRVSHE